MRNEPLQTMLSGDVESDETWIGPRLRGKGKGCQTENKVAVHALIQRGGPMRAKVIGRVTKDNLRTSLYETVQRDSRLLTDGLAAYRRLGPAFRAHESVDHTAGEYARGDVHCNTAESYFALLKRGVHGTFHHLSKQHLQRYCDEFAFRWNHRKVSDAQRTKAALKLAPGCRLTYRITGA